MSKELQERKDKAAYKRAYRINNPDYAERQRKYMCEYQRKRRLLKKQ